jgi:hypothetical protein
LLHPPSSDPVPVSIRGEPSGRAETLASHATSSHEL